MALIDEYSTEELKQIVQQSHNFSEVILKLGYSTNSGSNTETLKKRLKKDNIDTSHFKLITPIKRTEENVFIQNSTASQATVRRWYLKNEYTPYVCSICGLEPQWQGKDLTLILDHINGINNDDRLENLRWVCPNCNQQLETTGFKKMRTTNILKKKYYCSKCGKEIYHNLTGLCLQCLGEEKRIYERPSREELKQLIRTTTFSNLSKKFGASDNTIRKWCDSYNLPRRVKDIKSYSDEEWGINLIPLIAQ